MKVVLTNEAKAQVQKRRAWWRNNRAHKSLFEEAMFAARRVLMHAPQLKIHGTVDGQKVRRLSMPRVHCYAYFTIDAQQGLVTIIAICGQEVEKQPDFVDSDL